MQSVGFVSCVLYTMNSARVFRIFIPFFCLWLAGCSLFPSEIKDAEKLMETNPDSALQLLKGLDMNRTMTKADRALYGLLYFKALDKNKLPLKPDSILNYSLDYYLGQNDETRLANCYFFKGRTYKYIQRYDQATLFYLKALDLLKNKKEYALLGKIYADMGDILSIQMEYNASREKYKISINYFNRAGKTIDASYRILDIGRTYHFAKDYKTAQQYYRQALAQTKDSIFCGVALQEIGINYYWAKQYDSAKYYLRQSLLYPHKYYNYAIRCYNLADLFFNTSKIDSAYHYATIALEHPSNFYTQRECYRILANTAFRKGDFNQMAGFMTSFQACTDSVGKIEAQTKTTVLENIHQTNANAGKIKYYLLIIGWILPVIVLLSLFIVIRLRKRTLGKEQQLEQVEQQLSQNQTLLIKKQTLLRRNLIQKIKDAKSTLASVYKKSTPAQREAIDLELYNSCLYIKDWNEFSILMNHTFNNLISTLENTYPDITRKEMTWCCLFLLEIPTPEILLILDYKLDSLYKLKQRLVQKMNLKNAKELDFLLEQKIADK